MLQVLYTETGKLVDNCRDELNICDNNYAFDFMFYAQQDMVVLKKTICPSIPSKQ